MIGLIFCQITPLICVLALVNFIVCRLVYGYLLVFAETRKADLGGICWVKKLSHLQRGLWVFIILMSGVITAGGSRRQASIATLSGVYLFWAQRRFWKYDWIRLPFERIESLEEFPEHEGYVQPELARNVSSELLAKCNCSFKRSLRPVSKITRIVSRDSQGRAELSQNGNST